jgi:enoyl-[acyl-carrier-protein] reductase (NADH)
MGRAVKAEEVGYLTTFLCSDMAAMICGEIIGIDGGWLLSEV